MIMRYLERCIRDSLLGVVELVTGSGVQGNAIMPWNEFRTSLTIDFM